MFQFQVQSDFGLAGAAEDWTPHPPGAARLTVRRDSLDGLSLMRRVRPQRCYDVGQGLLFEGGHTLLYVGFGGGDIRVEVRDEDVAQATGLVTGRGISTASLFTGSLPLHAAGAVFDGHYFGLLAPSGTGKSTTLRAVLNAGGRFANEDIIPVSFSGERHTAYPSVSPAPKMHKAALEAEGITHEKLIRVSPFDEKFWMPLPPAQCWVEPSSLSALFLLTPVQSSQREVLVRRLPNEAAAARLLDSLHGLRSIEKYLDMTRLSSSCETLARAVPVYTVEYEKRLDNLPRLVEAVRAAAQSPVATLASF